MENRIAFIYALVDPRNNQVKYIGKTILQLKRRLYCHQKYPCSRKCKMWFLELNSLGLNPQIKEIDRVTECSWEESERYWIKFYREMYGGLLNIRSGGNQIPSDVNVGRKHTEQYKKLMSDLMKGNKFSVGRYPTVETKLKMSQTHKVQYEKGERRKDYNPIHFRKSINVYDVNKEFIGAYTSYKEASKSLGICRNTITDHFKKKTGTASSGYYFEKP